MRTSSKWTNKWTKWQIALVSAMVVIYLFQKVKDSPEFLIAVRDAATSKADKTEVISPAVVNPPATSGTFDRNSNDRMERRGRSREQLNRTQDSFTQTQPQQQQTQPQQQPQAQTHTRSHAS